MNREVWKLAYELFITRSDILDGAVRESLRKHQGIVKAWLDGAEIQWRATSKDSWQSSGGSEEYGFFPSHEYRVKPENMNEHSTMPKDWRVALEAHPQRAKYPFAIKDCCIAMCVQKPIWMNNAWTYVEPSIRISDNTHCPDPGSLYVIGQSDEC